LSERRSPLDDDDVPCAMSDDFELDRPPFRLVEDPAETPINRIEV
jgi:hypothetical protein